MHRLLSRSQYVYDIILFYRPIKPSVECMHEPTVIWQDTFREWPCMCRIAVKSITWTLVVVHSVASVYSPCRAGTAIVAWSVVYSYSKLDDVCILYYTIIYRMYRSTYTIYMYTIIQCPHVCWLVLYWLSSYHTAKLRPSLKGFMHTCLQQNLAGDTV